MRQAPWALIGLRVLLGPVLAIGVLLEVPPWLNVGLFGLAFLSDVFDGILARRLGVAAARLRLADSLADTLFYICLAGACVWHYAAQLGPFWLGLGLLIALELLRTALELKKFGRTAAYHMWSAKAWGVSLLLGLGQLLLTGQPGLLLGLAIGLGILTDIEGLIASLLLDEWSHDVRGIWRVPALRRQQRREREQLAPSTPLHDQE